SWWGKSVDETIWVSKNAYAFFSDAFKGEWFYNRGGFVGVEKVPKDAVEAIEKEFAKRKRAVPAILVEESHPWDKMRRFVFSKGYTVSDRMLVMESPPRSKAESASNPEVEVDVVGPRDRQAQLEWTRTYLRAFYGNQKLAGKVDEVMRKVVKDKNTSVFLAKIGRESVGCASMYRTAGKIAGVYAVGTDPDFRTRGVAATMLKRMREVANEEGRRLILQTMVSDRLEGFYKKQGFSLVYAKSLFERRRKKGGTEDLPSGESFGVRMNRDAGAGEVMPFNEVFSGFEAVEAVRALFGPETDEVLSKLKISLDSPRGYLRVDGETGNVIINPEYLRTGHERHLYL
ncbi:MAG: GNAT family N-acetyltransferase, partial [Nitrososphaerales archaeon]